MTDPGDFRVSVHDGRNGAVVDVTVTLVDVLNGSDSLLFGLVGKHRSECAVSDSADVGNLGAVLLVDDQAAPVVGLKADVVQTKTRCVWAATDGNENDVSVHL